MATKAAMMARMIGRPPAPTATGRGGHGLGHVPLGQQSRDGPQTGDLGQIDRQRHRVADRAVARGRRPGPERSARLRSGVRRGPGPVPPASSPLLPTATGSSLSTLAPPTAVPASIVAVAPIGRPGQRWRSPQPPRPPPSARRRAPSARSSALHPGVGEPEAVVVGPVDREGRPGHIGHPPLEGPGEQRGGVDPGTGQPAPQEHPPVRRPHGQTVTEDGRRAPRPGPRPGPGSGPAGRRSAGRSRVARAAGGRSSGPASTCADRRPA